MKGSVASALPRRWTLWLLASLLWCCNAAALAQPAAATPATEASERQALRERLHEAQARLTDLEQNIRALERRLDPAPEASAPAALPSSSPVAAETWAIPVHWLWLGVLTVVILMVGITYSGRPERKKTPLPDSPVDDERAQFHARLGGLDLSLDLSPDGQSQAEGSASHRP